MDDFVAQRFADHVTAIDDRDHWWLVGLLKVVVTRLQLFPEIRVV